jgi:non-heme chloroperoxidase
VVTIMGTLRTFDGTQLYFKDWGEGQPVVFSHAWPVCSDAWDVQLRFMADNGFRAIAHDRRGHGRSTQSWRGNDYNTYADDLAQLLDYLDLQDVILVGNCMGGGEVVRYLARHGSSRVSKVVLVSAVPPLMLRRMGQPNGIPMAIFDGMRQEIVGDRTQFYADFARSFYGAPRSGMSASEGTLDHFLRMSLMGGLHGHIECIGQLSETDFTEDLRKIDIPMLVIHGDDDQVAPVDITARRVAVLVDDVELKVYPGAPHGLTVTHVEQFNDDLLTFAKQQYKDHLLAFARR